MSDGFDYRLTDGIVEIVCLACGVTMNPAGDGRLKLCEEALQMKHKEGCRYAAAMEKAVVSVVRAQASNRGS